MSDNKIQQNDSDVLAYLGSVEPNKKQQECFEVLAMMETLSGHPAKMWGTSMIGFGSYHYKYDSGREGDAKLTGFAPRKQALTIYIMAGFSAYDDLMKQLGKYKTGKSCLYIKSLDDIDRDVLKQLISASLDYMRNTYPTKE